MSDTNYIGKSMPQYDAEGRMSGKTVYVDDVRVPGMCFVKVLRSPVHKGIIKNIDASAALKIPGVVGVLTYKDVPGVNIGWLGACEVFAEKNLRFKGHAICAVVGETEDIAQAGVEAIIVDIEEQTPVFNMFEAMKPGAPLVVEGSKDNMAYWGDNNYFTMKLGDVDEGFKMADHIIESEFYQGSQDHASMEPNVSVAYTDDSGRLCIHTTSQCLYFQLGSLCAVFGLPMSKIRYIGGVTGGGFGGRNEIYTDHIAGVAALRFGRAVKYCMTRSEDFLCTHKRGEWKVHYKDGVMNDGRIVARHITHWHDAGNVFTFAPYGIEKCSLFMCGPYHIPNILIHGYCILTNKPHSSTVRGYTAINGQVGADVQLQKIANTLGMDSWEVRALNAWRDGDMGAGRYIVEGAGALEALKSTAEMSGVKLSDKVTQMNSRGR